VADLFIDRDTELICGGRVHRLSRLKDLSLLAGVMKSISGVVFAGGLESVFDEAERVVPSEKRLFSAASGLSRIANVDCFNAALSKANADKYPLLAECSFESRQIVIKDAFHSGTARRFAADHSADLSTLGESYVAQLLIQGQSISAVFVASAYGAYQTEVKCLGVSEQLLGGRQDGCFSRTEFQWCGNVTSIVLSISQKDQALKVAESFANEFELTGVFGIDFIVNQEGVWPVDVNPRIPASSELFGPMIMVEHLRAFKIGVSDPFDNQTQRDGFIAPEAAIRGKAIVYNLENSLIKIPETVNEKFPFRHESDLQVDSIADVPDSSVRIDPGQPILTVFSSGASRTEVLDRLKQMADQIRQLAREC
jgi:hypothetical protein